MLQASTKKKDMHSVCLFGKPEGRDNFEDLGVDESI